MPGIALDIPRLGCRRSEWSTTIPGIAFGTPRCPEGSVEATRGVSAESFPRKYFNFTPAGTGFTHGGFQKSDVLLPHHGHLRPSGVLSGAIIGIIYQGYAQGSEM